MLLNVFGMALDIANFRISALQNAVHPIRATDTRFLNPSVVALHSLEVVPVNVGFTGLDLVDRVGCPVEALGEDSRSQAHRAVVAHFNGILQVLEGHNWQNRPEDFVLNSGTFLGDVGQNGWFVEEALAFHWLTTNNDLGPFLNGLLDLAVDLFEGRLVNQRAHANVRVLNGVTSANNLSGVRPDGSAHFTEDGHQVDDMFDQSSFTTTTVVRERNAVKVPKDLDLRKLGPLGCGYVTGSGTVFNTLKPEPGSTIAVTGTGAVGLAAMMAGKISGCTKVIAIDRVPERLALAKELGATDAINTNDQDMVKAIQDLTDGKGVDYIVDTTGVTKVMEDAIQALAQGGVLAAIAVTAQHIDVNTWNDLCPADRTIVGVNMGDSIPQVDIPRLIEFYKLGMFDFDKTEKFYDFDQINEANADSVSGKTIKPVLIIDKDYQPGD